MARAFVSWPQARCADVLSSEAVKCELDAQDVEMVLSTLPDTASHPAARRHVAWLASWCRGRRQAAHLLENLWMAATANGTAFPDGCAGVPLWRGRPASPRREARPARVLPPPRILVALSLASIAAALLSCFVPDALLPAVAGRLSGRRDACRRAVARLLWVLREED